jgi:DNA mismatch repair ATPase MutS
MQGRLYARFDADYDKWMSVVRSVAHLDCLVSLSMFNDSGLGEPKCRPEFVEGEGVRTFLEFEELRHPCIVEGYDFCLIHLTAVLNKTLFPMTSSWAENCLTWSS